MSDERERQRARIDGRTAFAGAAFLIGVGLIYLLARVGAPDGLVRALGPLFAAAGVGLIGVLTRSSRVPAFFAADRAIPAPYAGLAFAAIAGGFVLCLHAPADDLLLPLAGVAAGLCIDALVVGPFLRATKASALSDLMATRFPSLPLRALLLIVLFTIGALMATAGLETAADALVGQLGFTRPAAVALIAVVTLLMTAPGGLAGLLWGAAASAGMILIILALPLATLLSAGDSPIAPLVGGAGLASQALAPSARFGQVDGFSAQILVALASALAVGALAPFTTAAIASSGERQALRAGGYGLLFAALIGLAAAFDLSLASAPSGAMASGLRTSAVLLAALTLAGAGVLVATRAWGVNMAARHDRYAPLASQRLARSRLAMIAVVGLGAVVAARTSFHPATALAVAAALSLCLPTPLIALALFSRATSIHAAAGALGSLATLLLIAAAERRIPSADRLLLGALASAAAGFVVGWSAAIFSPAGREAPPARHDLFIDAPLDPHV